VNVLSRRKLLTFASVVEAGTGVTVIIVPALVVRLLVGLDISADGVLLARCFGIALLGLAVACWRGRSDVDSSASFRGMLIYNLLITAFLGYLGAFEHVSGMLLWPGVLFHALFTGLLVLSRPDAPAVAR
jgi:hypothetical protein